MPIELLAEYKRAMRRIASTVTLVTSGDANGWCGIAATAVTSVCAEPPTLLICINNQSSVARPISSRKSFCVNVLRDSQAVLSEVFGGGLGAAERFSIGDWSVDFEGHPYLEDAQANLFCEVDSVVPYRTHNVIFGQVKRVRIFDEVAPLIYQDGKYARTSLLLDHIVVPAGQSNGRI